MAMRLVFMVRQVSHMKSRTPLQTVACRKTRGLACVLFPGISRLLPPACLVLCISSIQAEDTGCVDIADRVVSVKGDVNASGLKGGSAHPKAGDPVPWSSELDTLPGAGLLLRPLPTVNVVMFQQGRLRFDRGRLSKVPGKKSEAHYTLLEGKLSVTIAPRPNSEGKKFEGSASADKGKAEDKIKEVYVCTSRGEVESANGIWSVRESKAKTIVAVVQGKAGLIVGGCGEGEHGDSHKLIELSQGSVIVLQTDANDVVTGELINTVTGTVAAIGTNGSPGDPSPAPPATVASAQGYLGDSVASGSTPGGPNGLPGGNPLDPTRPGIPGFPDDVPNKPVASPAQP